MNYIANLHANLEYAFDVHLFHAQTIRLLFAFRHIAKTYDPNVKMLHLMLSGPPGIGKSRQVDTVIRATPPGIPISATHVTSQRNFADFPHVDAVTGTVEVRDEMDAAALGLDESGPGKGA